MGGDKTKADCETDDIWIGVPESYRVSMEVHASDNPPGKLGFELKPKRKRGKTSRK